MRSALDGLSEAIIVFAADASPNWEITMHCRTADGSANTAAKLIGLRDALTNLVTVTWPTTIVNAHTQIIETVARDLSPARLPDATQTVAVVGTRGGQYLANDSTLVVTKLTAKVGRAFRGRNYFSGRVGPDLVSQSSFDSAVAEEYEDYQEQLRTAIVGAAPQSYTPVIYHRKAGQGNVPPADTVDPITGSFGRILVASQRRRTRPIRR